MTKCLLIKAPDGSTRTVKMDGTPYTLRLGEFRAGRVDCPENGQPAPTEADNVKEKRTRAKLIKELDSELGKGFGDWIKVFAKPVAALIGKNRCSSCETRRVVTNAYAQLSGKYGQVEALRILKDLWQMSFNKEDEAVLEKLRAYLHGEESIS